MSAGHRQPLFKLTKMNVIGILFGIMFGAVLGASNLHEYDTIHNMLSLEEIDVFLFMGSAIAVSAPALWFLERRGFATPLGGDLKLSRPKPEAHHVKGGALFGIGWAIAGTCPAPALVMISSGAWMGLIALPGIFLGLHLRERQVVRQLSESVPEESVPV
ncbi:MAG: YeeE/YedE family protein [Acidimicrobiales bacterium]|nr:YeeE/YedE family protein [Acidimicrobiales bacterium]